jgi:uncharacterized protein (DUF2236 family)
MTASDRGSDPGLFGPDSVAWRIHADPVVFLAGFRALLLQACHPVAMAGMAANGRYRQDPWGRLHRTGVWIATTTFGTTGDAEAAGRALRALHAHLRGGVEPETGRPYRIDDPDLLLWVHCTEVESFLSTYRRAGGFLAPVDGDRYVTEMRESARLVGLDPTSTPATEAEIEQYYADVRPQLLVTRVARSTALWGFVPPMPTWVSLATPARPAWVGIMAISMGLLPRWARRLYGLPGLPSTDVSATLAARLLRQAALALPATWIDSPSRHEARERRAELAPSAG